MKHALLAILVLLSSGCLVSGGAEETWHQKYDWKAEKYFDDPLVIALCEAIEADDLEEIDRLVAAGADVNAKGKGNMTPLMWAYPDHKPKRFERLLKHGADPNVIITSDLGTGRESTILGTSVTHLATRSNLPEHFRALFDHGGDPDFLQKSSIGKNDTPLALLIKFGFPDKKKRIQVLIDRGVDLKQRVGSTTAPILAASWGGQYDIALMLLEAGADPKAYQSDGMAKLIHILVGEEQGGRASDPTHKSDFQKLVTWLEKRGESLDEARADIKRWASWSSSRKDGRKSEFRTKMDAEIAVRKAREAREQEVREKPVAIGKDES